MRTGAEVALVTSVNVKSIVQEIQNSVVSNKLAQKVEVRIR